MIRRLLLPAATAIALTVLAVIALARGGEPAAGGLVVIEAWARATPPGAATGAAYVTVLNRSDSDDRLIRVESAAAGAALLHETVEENGVSTMRHREDMPVAAGESLVMTPGGAHIMLMRLARPLEEGKSLPLTLVFEKAGALRAEATIAPIGAAAPPAHEHAM
jgi:copper(I)-binding protein